MPLTRDQILAADDLPRETVAVPEWGGDVIVRALTGQERDEYEVAMGRALNDADKGRGINMRARLVAMALIDAEGNRLFNHESHVERLGRKSGRALDRVFEVAQRLSGLGRAAQETAAGNSAGANGDAPSSASPSPSAAGHETSSAS